MQMVKTSVLTSSGESFALEIDRELADQMKVETGTTLKLVLDGRRLIVEALSEEEDSRRVDEIIEQTADENAELFRRGLRFLTLEIVLKIQKTQTAKFGGSAALLDQGRLESAIAQPRQQFASQYLHDNLAAMAAAYTFHIVQNHPFEDGNKRTGTHAPSFSSP
jgi:antitoxin component of MazEF toxin-antitoxin module